MANCPNCNAKLSCGCQKRTASNGKVCCASCIVNYEKSIPKVTKPSDLNIKRNPVNIKINSITVNQK